MTSALYRIGRTCARHPFRTFGVWFLLALVVVGASSAFGSEGKDSFKVPGVEAQQAFDRLEARFPTQAGAGGRLVFHSDEETLSDAGPAAALAAVVAKAATGADVTAVAQPQLSPDRHTGFVAITYDVPTLEKVHYTDAKAAIAQAKDAGLQAELDGVIAIAGEPEPRGQEVFGLIAAIVVLLIAFGSVIAMGIPVATAVIALAVGITGISIMARFVETPTYAPILAAMIGLGVGIDYALFIVTRHRANMAAGMDPAESAGRANATAGAAVLFAGATVVIAIGGLQVAGIPAITAMGYACALVVAVSVVAALTLLPAFLGWAGHGIDRLSIPHRKERNDHHQTASGRWANHVGHHPVRYAAIGLVALVGLAAPVVGLRIGVGDDGTANTQTTQRRAYDHMSEGFGAGFNGPLHVVVNTSARAADAALPKLEQALAATPGIAEVRPAVRNDAGDTAVIVATPRTSPQSEETSQLVDELRDSVIPAAIEGTTATVQVGSPTALANDLSNKLTERLPYFIGAVVLLSLLLLTVVFRSIVVPVKAAVMNLLSIGAAYGVLVAVFQWGWGKDLIGLEQTLPINPFVPLIMFAILFGLSMDYEVFLLSRVREAFVRTGDSHTSVVEGLSSTARVITSAALIMISVFGAFVFGVDPVGKMFGLGLAAAIFIDATLVRMVLVPATMSLLGNANWWLPRWMDRILPNVDFEGSDGAEVIELPEQEAQPVAA
ncbi:MAG: putative drug exporter of the superfamily [Actinomycetota bacterium]